jgi:hypothetical protein
MSFRIQVIFFSSIFKDSTKIVSGGLDEVVKVCDLESARGLLF